jgi:hypothetical protein
MAIYAPAGRSLDWGVYGTAKNTNTSFGGQSMRAKKSVCGRLEGFLLLTAVVFVFTSGCSEEKRGSGGDEQRENRWAQGTPAKDFKIANEREVLLAQSIQNLKAIRMALTMANQINGKYPARLNDAEIAKPTLLLSPLDEQAEAPRLPTGFAGWPLERQWQWAFDNCSYEYLPGQKEADGANILLYEKPKPHKTELPVYFMDGQAKLASPEQLTKLLEKQKAAGKLDDADRKPLAEEPPK